MKKTLEFFEKIKKVGQWFAFLSEWISETNRLAKKHFGTDDIQSVVADAPRTDNQLGENEQS